MGIFGKSNKEEREEGKEEEEAGGVFEVAGIELTCSHCGGTRFTKDEAQLNTAIMSLLNLDWLNETADIYTCEACGHIEWFADKHDESTESW